jgi:hypothetical protein
MYVLREKVDCGMKRHILSRILTWEESQFTATAHKKTAGIFYLNESASEPFYYFSCKTTKAPHPPRGNRREGVPLKFMPFFVLCLCYPFFVGLKTCEITADVNMSVAGFLQGACPVQRMGID